MRIDKYLKVSRIIKRRTVAAASCEGGKVKVNGKSVKPSYDVKVGDEIEINLGAPICIVVKALAEVVSKDGASDLYETKK